MRKLLLNCDQVFDVLTRGPFPTGADSDDAVEHHLRACHECRQLAEALQPAVELLHEAIAPEQAADLPEYQGALVAVERAVATAECSRPRPLSIRRLAAAGTGERSSLPLAGYARFAVALVLLAALGSLAWGIVTTSKHTRGPGELLFAAAAPGGPKTVARLDDRGLMTLTSLNLPVHCFPRGALIDSTAAGKATPPAGINQDALECCTQCHNPANPGRPAIRTIAAMQRSCVACHSL
jgi:hypothetical protein